MLIVQLVGFSLNISLFYVLFFVSLRFSPIDMERMQNLINASPQPTVNFYANEPLSLLTSLLNNSNGKLTYSTEQTPPPPTTAAIIPSTTFPGVGIVIYEAIDSQQPI